MKADVIVIGGGASGLIASRNLSNKGKKVVLLEAAARFGGRINTITDPDFDQELEMGAEFIHGDLPITMELLTNAHIPFQRTEGVMYYNENCQWQKGNEPLAGWDKLISKMATLQKDMVLDDFLEVYFAGEAHEKLRIHARRYAAGFDLADSSAVSTFGLRDEWMNEEEALYRVTGGYIKLIDQLVDECRKNKVVMHLSSLVTSVKWEKDNVIIFTKNGNVLMAQKLIVTIPVNILASNKAGAILFDPPIDQYLSAAAQIGTGSVIKVFFQFEESFWLHQQKDPGFIISNQVIPTWWTNAPDKPKLLTGWLGGPGAKVLRGADETIIRRLALQSLANIFSVEIDHLENLLTAWKIADWNTTPFIEHAYSYPKLNTAASKKILQKSCDNTIYFAGEGIYATDSPGTVEAALFSGIAAADMILQEKLAARFKAEKPASP